MRNACLRQQVLVVLQEAAQSLLAAHFAIAATHPLFSPWKKRNIFFTLMVSLSMVVLGERRYRSPQGRLAEQNQPRPSRQLIVFTPPAFNTSRNDTQNLVSRSCGRYRLGCRRPSSSRVAFRAD